MTRPRNMPPVAAIVAHWRSHADELPSLEAHWIGWGEPFCFACTWMPPVPDGKRDSWERASRWLDRAHLQDHCVAGNDDAANLVLLCHLCHDDMPPFDTRDDALAWVAARPRAEGDWQAFTDARLTRSAVTRTTTLLRARVKYLSAAAGKVA